MSLRIKISWLRNIAKGILILAGLGLMGFVGYNVYTSVVNRPNKVRVSNITDSSVTVSWVTSSPTRGVVYYSEKDMFVPYVLSFLGSKVGYDDRDWAVAQKKCVDAYNEVLRTQTDGSMPEYDCENLTVNQYGNYYVHHVTLRNLDESKEYFFRVSDVLLSWNFGSVNKVTTENDYPLTSSFSFKTSALLTEVPKPNLAYGKVYGIQRNSAGFLEDKPSNDSIVFSTVNLNDFESQLVSTVTNEQGGWTYDKSNFRNTEGNLVGGLTDGSMKVCVQFENGKPRECTNVGDLENDTVLDTLMGNSEEDLGVIRSSVLGVVSKLFAEEDCKLGSKGPARCDAKSCYVCENNGNGGTGWVLKTGETCPKPLACANEYLRPEEVIINGKVYHKDDPAVKEAKAKGKAKSVVNPSRTDQKAKDARCNYGTCSECSQSLCNTNKNGCEWKTNKCEASASQKTDLQNDVKICSSYSSENECPSVGCVWEKERCMTKKPSVITPGIPPVTPNGCGPEGQCKKLGTGDVKVCRQNVWMTFDYPTCEDYKVQSQIQSKGNWYIVDEEIKDLLPREGICVGNAFGNYFVPDGKSTGIVFDEDNMFFCIAKIKDYIEENLIINDSDLKEKLKLLANKECLARDINGRSYSIMKCGEVTDTYDAVGSLDVMYTEGNSKKLFTKENDGLTKLNTEYIFTEKVNNSNLNYIVCGDDVVNIDSGGCKDKIKTVQEGIQQGDLTYVLDPDTKSLNVTPAFAASSLGIDDLNKKLGISSGDLKSIINYDSKTGKSSWNKGYVCNDKIYCCNSDGKLCDKKGVDVTSGCKDGWKIQKQTKACTSTQTIDNENNGNLIASAVLGTTTTQKTTTSNSEISSRQLTLDKDGFWNINGEDFYLESGKKYYVAFDINQNGKYDPLVDPLMLKDDIKIGKNKEAQTLNLSKGINIISFNFVGSISEKDEFTAKKLMEFVNSKEIVISRMTRFEGGKWNGGLKATKVGGEISGNDFPLSPGSGYLVISEQNTTLQIPGKKLLSSIPLVFGRGWNLLSLNGYTKAYTAKSLIQSVNTDLKDINADNVTWWPTSKGKYEGLQITKGTEYGFDFPLYGSNGYFVRITKIDGNSASCKFLIWNPGGELNGQCVTK